MNKMAMNMRGGDWLWLIYIVFFGGLIAKTTIEAIIEGDVFFIFFGGMLTFFIVWIGFININARQTGRELRKERNGRN